MATVHLRHGQMDGRLTIAILRDALSTGVLEFHCLCFGVQSLPTTHAD